MNFISLTFALLYQLTVLLLLFITFFANFEEINPRWQILDGL